MSTTQDRLRIRISLCKICAKPAGRPWDDQWLHWRGSFWGDEFYEVNDHPPVPGRVLRFGHSQIVEHGPRIREFLCR